MSYMETEGFPWVLLRAGEGQGGAAVLQIWMEIPLVPETSLQHPGPPTPLQFLMTGVQTHQEAAGTKSLPQKQLWKLAKK